MEHRKEKRGTAKLLKLDNNIHPEHNTDILVKIFHKDSLSLQTTNESKREKDGKSNQ
jgi:hypothetical protein